MNGLRHVFWLVTCLAGSVPILAQEHMVHGIVRDVSNTPLAGANVSLKNSNRGVVTDPEGSFSLNARPGDSLQISYVGYHTKSVSVGTAERLTIVLLPNASILNKLVVVGYGTQRSRDVTGSISSLGASKIKDLPVATLGESMAAQMSGVTVQQTTGRPGAPVVVRVRGTGSISAGNAPLYVVDGFALPENANLSTINPADIASIEVLKDASASAIYGSRGGNGVVLITTKRGVSGKPVYAFNYFTGFSSVAHRMNMLNAKEFVDVTLQASENAYLDRGGDPSIPVAQRPYGLAPIFFQPDKWVNTDWQDVIFQKAKVDNYQLSVSGGNQGMKYYLSGGYLNQQGVIRTTRFERYSFRSNLELTLSPAVKIGVNMSPSFIKERQAHTDGNYASTTSEGILMAALLTQPFLPPYQPDGSYTRPSLTQNGSSRNPLALLLEVSDIENTFQNFGNVYMDVKLAKGLNFHMSPGADFLYSRRNYFRPTTVPASGVSVANGYQTTSQNINLIWENTLTFDHDFNEDHSLKILGGYTAQWNRSEDNRITATGYPNDLVGSVNAATSRIGSAGEEQWALASMLMRVNYRFKDRYLFTANFRRDGSSRFGALTRWGNFPSASVGWQVNQEPFLRDQHWLEELKIRASYGLTGNNNIANYGSIGLVSANDYVLGAGSGSLVSGLAQSTLSNPDLTWEKNKQFDLGADLGLWAGRVQFTADYYQRVSSDLLLNVQVPSVSGFTMALRNIGKVKNTGFEFAVSSHNLTGIFQWTTSLNLSLNQNKVLATGPSGSPIYAGSYIGNTNITQVGSPIGSFYGYKAAGVFKDQEALDKYPHFSTSRPGDVKYLDLNSDGIIDPKDMTLIGNPNPKFLYGVTNTFQFKHFDLNVIVQGVQGNSIAHLYLRVYEGGFGGGTNQRKGVLKGWKSPEDPGDGQHPRLNASVTGNNNYFSSRWVEDGSYCRLRNLTLGYQLPQRMMKKIRLESARIYFSGENLLTITNYSGFNPEVGNNGESSIQPGIDFGVYPINRTFTLGLNIGL